MSVGLIDDDAVVACNGVTECDQAIHCNGHPDSDGACREENLAHDCIPFVFV
jgi:hypothetical protein